MARMDHCGGFAFLGCQAWEWHHLITGAHNVLVDGKLEQWGQSMSTIHGDLLCHMRI